MKLFFFYFLLFLFTGNNFACAQECAPDINKLPMYGRVKKCKEQIEDDNRFLSSCDAINKNRKQVALHFIDRGWQYYYSKNLDTSMMRFNQAWLLDSLNADIYWGFANLLGVEGKFKESIPLFERSLQLNPGNSKVWQNAANSYGNVFFETKDIKYLNSSINSLKKAINLDSKNPVLYGQLTSAYCYFMQKDSARKYLKITDQLDPNAVNPDARKMLNN